MKQGQFPAVFNLADLNGKNGFKIDAEKDYRSDSRPFAARDINGDQIDDVLIGGRYYADSTGRSYVLFGGKEVGSSGLISLSTLDGSNGFKMDGDSYSASGWVATGVGDVNGDQHDDVLIGAPGYNSYTGRSYLVFGGQGVGSSGFIALSALNGINGFKLDGDVASNSGVAVNMEGDVNGDGITDLLVGAMTYNNSTGRVYVVFGGKEIGSSGLIPLPALNGESGFILNGEFASSYTGSAISTRGDFNGDGIRDVLIGSDIGSMAYVVFGNMDIGSSGSIALSALNGTDGFKMDVQGRFVSAVDINGDLFSDIVIDSYVVFGSKTIGSSGLIELATLNGSNGFKFSEGVYTGIPGDINGDQIEDLVAWGNSNTYVVFGDKNLGSSGIVMLSELDGCNGFKLEGEINITTEVSTATGDINGDQVNDLLIGAPSYDGNTGRSYVIFGDIPAVLVNNSLILFSDETILLSTSNLAAYDRNHDNNTLIFIPTNITHGQFELIDNPGTVLSNFTQQQIWNQQIRFVHDGSMEAPTYNITVRSEGIAWTGPYPANINFVVPLTMITNQLTLSNGQTVVLSLNNLQANETGVSSDRLIFSIGNLRNGYFSSISSGGAPVKLLAFFTQAQIENATIQFVHNGQNQAPAYSVIVSDGVQAIGPSIAKINFAGAPVIIQNTLNITVGGSLILTPSFINVTITDGSLPDQVILMISNLQHATITSTITKMPVNRFTLADLQAGTIQLTQDGSFITPGYTLTAQGLTAFSSAPNSAQIYFSNQGIFAPQLVDNYLLVTQGQTTRLNNGYLSAIQPDGPPLNNSLFYLDDIRYGHFNVIGQPQFWISFFNQSQLSSEQVEFVHDGSLMIPGYSVMVKDRNSGLASASEPAGIFFTPVGETPSGNNDEFSDLQKALFGAVTSGVVGIFFAILKICMKRAANKKLLQALGEGEDDYDIKVVRPVAKEIARQIKITGFMSYTTNTEMAHFKSAVRSILSELDARGLDLNFQAMSAMKRDSMINIIAQQARRIVVTDRMLSCHQRCVSFFQAQATAQEIQDAAPAIADAVIQSRRSMIQGARLRLMPSGGTSNLPRLTGGQSGVNSQLQTPLLQALLQ